MVWFSSNFGDEGGKSSFKTKHGKYEFAYNPFPYSSSVYVILDLISKKPQNMLVNIMYGGGGGRGRVVCNRI